MEINEREVEKLTIFLPKDRRKAGTLIIQKINGATFRLPMAMSSPAGKLILVFLQLVVNWYNRNHRGQLAD